MNKEDSYYRAMLARDFRFDGQFFVGVKTTGIYCRPVCPAIPKRENVEFFETAYAAENAGYRPCLRCRPESAPGSPAWIGKSAVVRRALREIATGQANYQNEADFAQKFGVTTRHLRRLFNEEIGKTPRQIFYESRLNFARKLIIETNIQITEIAFLAGFGSIRRFNDAIQKRFARSPTQLRGKSSQEDPDKHIAIELPYRPPFNWGKTIAPHKRHEIFGVETIYSNVYERILKADKTIGHISISQNPGKHSLKLQITPNCLENLHAIMCNARQVFDLDADPFMVANAMGVDKSLNRIYNKNPGLRIPRGWNAFETSIGAILGQLVSVTQSNRLVRQLIEQYGEKVTHPLTQEDAYLFPAQDVLATASLDGIGTTQSRKKTINAFSQALLEGKIRLDQAQDYENFIKSVLTIKGIGPWTAEYIALRALGFTDAFPKEDLVIKKTLKHFSGIDDSLIRPWRSYLTIYLWNFHSESHKQTAGVK